jgi:hypothetical protein
MASVRRHSVLPEFSSLRSANHNLAQLGVPVAVRALLRHQQVQLSHHYLRLATHQPKDATGSSNHGLR